MSTENIETIESIESIKEEKKKVSDSIFEENDEYMYSFYLQALAA